MKSMYVQILILSLIFQMGCQSSVNPTARRSPVLIEKEVIEIANQEARRRGIDPQYTVHGVRKRLTTIYASVNSSLESCRIVLDENGRTIEFRGENADKFSFLNGPGSVLLKNEEDAKTFLFDQLKMHFPDEPSWVVDCLCIPKGWMVFYRKDFSLGTGDNFMVILRENGTLHEIVPGK